MVPSFSHQNCNPGNAGNVYPAASCWMDLPSPTVRASLRCQRGVSGWYTQQLMTLLLRAPLLQSPLFHEWQLHPSRHSGPKLCSHPDSLFCHHWLYFRNAPRIPPLLTSFTARVSLKVSLLPPESIPPSWSLFSTQHPEQSLQSRHAMALQETY